MNTATTQTTELWPLVVYFIAVVVLLAAMVGLSYVLGERHMTRATAEPFESGVVTVGYARMRVSVKFYLVAMFFVIFDVEALFLFAWAISYREVGWLGYIEMLVFVGILLAALAYLWRLGALDWAPGVRGVSYRVRPREEAGKDEMVR